MSTTVCDPIFRDSRETRFKQWCVQEGDNVKMNNVAPNPLQWYISTLVSWVTGRSLASRLLSSGYVLTTVIIVSAILVAHELLPFDLGRAALTSKLGTGYYMHAIVESTVVGSGSCIPIRRIRIRMHAAGRTDAHIRFRDTSVHIFLSM